MARLSKMKKICILKTAEQVDEACHLLYKVYIEKMGWQFLPDNPSKLRIEYKNGRALLIDRFTKTATWFGLFDGQKMVACIRLHGLDENGLLEAEGFRSAAPIGPYLQDGRASLAELTKFAILSEHISQGAIHKVFLEAFRYCRRHKLKLVCNTNNAFLLKYYSRIGFPLKIADAFKYEPQDYLPVNFYLADKEDLKHMIFWIERKLQKNTDVKMTRALHEIAELLPIPLYWHDKDGAVLGINDHCLQAIGCQESILGMTPYDFYPEDVATHILSHNQEVMDSGLNSAQEERVIDISDGSTKYFTSVKAPLRNDEGKIIGIVGTSFEITGEKEAERLRRENHRLEMENKFQNQLLKEQNNFKEVISQAVHDIRSPLAALSIMSAHGKNIPEEINELISLSIVRINDIAENLLTKYSLDKKNAVSKECQGKKKRIQVSLALQEIISEKKYEFYNIDIEYKIEIEPSAYLAFVYAEEDSFKRMISNIINNAVESYKDRPGVLHLKIAIVGDSIKIIICDNGAGMSESVRQKILAGVPVTEGKNRGHGIGYMQVREALERNNGILDIESSLSRGTKIILEFPKDNPEWIAEKIEFAANDTVLILDDDRAIHEAWNMRLREISSNLNIKCFEYAKDVFSYVENISDKDKANMVLLADYELLNQNINGIDVINKIKISRSLLVTSRFSSSDVHEQVKQSQIKMLPKLCLSAVPININ